MPRKWPQPREPEPLPGLRGRRQRSLRTRSHGVLAQLFRLCSGTGQRRPRPCEQCAGAGQETRTETVEVRIPAGIGDGDRVRVPGKGNTGLYGGSPGDLYISIHVAPNPAFRREGDDFHLILPIAVHEAALGTRVDVPTPDGGIGRLRVPPGTQSGQRFRLRDRGAASARDGRRGDLIVEVRLMLPKVLDERSKELLAGIRPDQRRGVSAKRCRTGHRTTRRHTIRSRDAPNVAWHQSRT